MIDYERYLTKVQKLMREKNYAEARRILVQLDHPTAHLWLARLDEIQAEIGREKHKSRVIDENHGWSRAFKAAITVMLVWFVVNVVVVSVVLIEPEKPIWMYTSRQLTATQITSENLTAVFPLEITATADMRLSATETP